MLLAQPFSEETRVPIHQAFSTTSLVFSPRFCKFECNTTSDWLNCMVWPIRSCVTLNAANY